MRTRSVLILVPLVALLGCDGDEKAAGADSSPSASAVTTAASPPAESVPAAPAPESSSAAPSPSPERTRPAVPASGHPAAGFWKGPRWKDDVPTMMIGNDGALQLRSGGFLCTGQADPGPGSFRLRFTQCIVPLPLAKATLAADSQTMKVVTTENGRKKTETWRRFSA